MWPVQEEGNAANGHRWRLPGIPGEIPPQNVWAPIGVEALLLSAGSYGSRYRLSDVANLRMDGQSAPSVVSPAHPPLMQILLAAMVIDRSSVATFVYLFRGCWHNPLYCRIQAPNLVVPAMCCGISRTARRWRTPKRFPTSPCALRSDRPGLVTGVAILIPRSVEHVGRIRIEYSGGLPHRCWLLMVAFSFAASVATTAARNSRGDLSAGSPGRHIQIEQLERPRRSSFPIAWVAPRTIVRKRAASAGPRETVLPQRTCGSRQWRRTMHCPRGI